MLYKEFTDQLEKMLNEMAKMLKFLSQFEKFTNQICRILSILITKKSKVVPENLDLFNLTPFNDVFDVKNYIKQNFKIFISFTPVLIWTQDSSTKNILEILTINQILQYKDHSGSSLISLLIKHSSNQIIWECLEKILPKDASDEVLKPRLDMLLEKDENDLNLIDYSFLRRKNVVGEYVQGMLKRINGDESV